MKNSHESLIKRRQNSNLVTSQIVILIVENLSSFHTKFLDNVTVIEIYFEIVNNEKALESIEQLPTTLKILHEIFT